MNMKKTILMMMLLSGVCSVNAQYYIGGSIGISDYSTKWADGDENTVLSFSVAPELGYSLTDKLDIGIALNFSTLKRTNMTVDAEGNSIDIKVNSFQFAPYIRYSLLTFNKFAVLGKVQAFAGYEKQKYTTEMTDMNWGANIYPILTYNLTDKFVLLSNLNFFSIGFSQNKRKDVATSTGFSFSADSNNLLNVGDITIGFAYKF
jgi:hypothetical protein